MTKKNIRSIVTEAENHRHESWVEPCQLDKSARWIGKLLEGEVAQIIDFLILSMGIDTLACVFMISQVLQPRPMDPFPSGRFAHCAPLSRSGAVMYSKGVLSGFPTWREHYKSLLLWCWENIWIKRDVTESVHIRSRNFLNESIHLHPPGCHLAEGQPNCLMVSFRFPNKHVNWNYHL